MVLFNVSFLWRALESNIHPSSCIVSGKMFVITYPGIEMIDLANAVKGSDIIFSDPANHKIYKFII